MLPETSAPVHSPAPWSGSIAMFQMELTIRDAAGKMVAFARRSNPRRYPPNIPGGLPNFVSADTLNPLDSALMVAAPRLLAALKAMCERFRVNELVEGTQRPGDWLNPCDQQTYDQAMAAIAAAETPVVPAAPEKTETQTPTGGGTGSPPVVSET